MKVDLSTILGLFCSKQFMSCPGAVICLSLYPASFPPVSKQEELERRSRGRVGLHLSTLTPGDIQDDQFKQWCLSLYLLTDVPTHQLCAGLVSLPHQNSSVCSFAGAAITQDHRLVVQTTEIYFLQSWMLEVRGQGISRAGFSWCVSAWLADGSQAWGTLGYHCSV